MRSGEVSTPVMLITERSRGSRRSNCMTRLILTKEFVDPSDTPVHRRGRPQRRAAGRLCSAPLPAMGLEDIAFLEILEAGDADAALEAGGHLVHVILEAAETGDGAVDNDGSVPEDAAAMPRVNRPSLTMTPATLPARPARKTARTVAVPCTTSL